MSQRFWLRLYDRFFDRPERDFSIDPARIEWIREHEPHRLRSILGVTTRNARRILQIGFLSIGFGIWFGATTLWQPADSTPVRWFMAGLLVGTGWMAIAQSRLFAYLAYLRGESGDPRRAEPKEASGRSSPQVPGEKGWQR